MFAEAQNSFRTPKKLFGPLCIFRNLIFWPQKVDKSIVFKKPEFCDLTEHWGWFPQWAW